MTEVQRVVVKARVVDGYKIIGNTVSLMNGLKCVMLVKNSHTLVINTLGYDEHRPNINWRVYE